MAGILNLSAIIPPSVVKLQMGVGKYDITEEQILESGLYDELVLDLYLWFPKYAELLNNISSDTAVTMQQIAVKTYGKLFLCRKLAMTGRLAFWQKDGDGENKNERYTLDWSKVILEWEEEMDRARGTVLGIDTEFTPVEEKQAVSGANVVGVSRPAVDSVRR